MERDACTRRELIRQGWRVFVIWECEIDEGAMDSLACSIRDGEQILKARDNENNADLYPDDLFLQYR